MGKTKVIDLTTSEEESIKRSRTERCARGEIGNYPHGTVKMIQSAADQWDKDKISFDEILRTHRLLKCILTSYVVEDEWLFPKLYNVSQVIVCRDNGRKSGRETIGNVTLVYPQFPHFPAYGVMHCKLMLLFYSFGWLRIVISSGNLVPYDYDQVQNVQHICMDI